MYKIILSFRFDLLFSPFFILLKLVFFSIPFGWFLPVFCDCFVKKTTHRICSLILESLLTATRIVNPTKQRYLLLV